MKDQHVLLRLNRIATHQVEYTVGAVGTWERRTVTLQTVAAVDPIAFHTSA